MPIPKAEDLLNYEKKLWNLGYRFIAGIDEAGRGPLAGPVVSACVIFEPSFIIEGVYDSKSLSSRQREILYQKIISDCVCYSIGIVDNETIDRINILEAAKLSMKMAVEKLSRKPEYILVDAVKLNLPIPVEPIIKGDQKSHTIAAASIIAKVYRDDLMRKLHNEYPIYKWNENKGYPTKAHREAIKSHGFSPYHRKTFKVN